jgi:hypothetical protein
MRQECTRAHCERGKYSSPSHDAGARRVKAVSCIDDERQKQTAAVRYMASALMPWGGTLQVFLQTALLLQRQAIGRFRADSQVYRTQYRMRTGMLFAQQCFDGSW